MVRKLAALLMIIAIFTHNSLKPIPTYIMDTGEGEDEFRYRHQHQDQMRMLWEWVNNLPVYPGNPDHAPELKLHIYAFISQKHRVTDQNRRQIVDIVRAKGWKLEPRCECTYGPPWYWFD